MNVRRKYGPFGLCLVAGIALIFYPQCWPMESTVHALRDALMVAALIGLTIEMFSASVLVDRAANELSERLIGYGLPPDAQDVIASIVRTTRVYRNYRKAYSLSLREDGKMLVRIISSYMVVNNGKETDRGYLPRADDEGMYNPQLISLAYGTTVVTDGIAITKHDPTTKVVSFVPTQGAVDIAPSKASTSDESLRREQYCEVRWESTLVMPQDYSDVIWFGGVTVKPSIELLNIPKGFEFEGTDNPDENKCDHIAGSSSWKYNRAFVRSQHVRVWWRKKPLPADDVSSEPSVS